MGCYIQYDGGQRYFDVTTDETHESHLEITEHPVETGPNITENTRKHLDRITIDVFVSNSPVDDLNGYGGALKSQVIKPPTPDFTIPINPAGALTALAGAAVTAIGNAIFGGPDPIKINTLQWDTPFNQVKDTHLLLKWLQDYSILCTLITPHCGYTNMLLEVEEMKRSARDGTGARFRLTFKQIRTVSLAFTDSPLPAEPRGQSALVKGQQGTKAAPPQKSVAAKLADDGLAKLNGQ